MNGLIEKAAEALAGETPKAPGRGAPAGAETPFDIDMASLAKNGFYTPGASSSQLALELRAVKRRLLRRLGLRKAAGERWQFQKAARPRNLVLVTSARPGEGKTFCAANLALSFAFEEKLDVLLVDADAPRPKLRAIFGLPDGPGLADCLADSSLCAQDVAHRARQAPLSVLTEGRMEDLAVDLYTSGKARRALAELSMARPRGLVIFDAPPALAAEEAGLLARHVDEIVFIVEADATPEPAASAALDELLEANANVSLILNRCLVSGGSAYYSSYENYDRVRAGDSAPAKDNEEGKPQ